jgi:flagellar assembly factor FliW
MTMTVASEPLASSRASVEVHSSRFGSFAVPTDRVLRFPEGLVGFPNYHRFVIVEHTRPGPLRWLLCLDEPDLAFAVADPAEFFPDYGAEALGCADLGHRDDLVVFAIVTIPRERPVAMSANLMAPLVVNVGTREARQVILDTDLYSTRHLLLPNVPPTD